MVVFYICVSIAALQIRSSMPFFLGFPGGSAGKDSAWHEGDLGLMSGLGISLGEGNSCILQYSGLENSMDCISMGSQSWTLLSDFLFYFHMIFLDSTCIHVC